MVAVVLGFVFVVMMVVFCLEGVTLEDQRTVT